MRESSPGRWVWGCTSEGSRQGRQLIGCTATGSRVVASGFDCIRWKMQHWVGSGSCCF